jgi:hypothetical protein
MPSAEQQEKAPPRASRAAALRLLSAGLVFLAAAIWAFVAGTGSIDRTLSLVVAACFFVSGVLGLYGVWKTDCIGRCP